MIKMTICDEFVSKDKMKKLSHYNNTYREALRDKINRIKNRVFSRDDLTTDHSNREQLRLN